MRLLGCWAGQQVPAAAAAALGGSSRGCAAEAALPVLLQLQWGG